MFNISIPCSLFRFLYVFCIFFLLWSFFSLLPYSCVVPRPELYLSLSPPTQTLLKFILNKIINAIYIDMLFIAYHPFYFLAYDFKYIFSIIFTIKSSIPPFLSNFVVKLWSCILYLLHIIFVFTGSANPLPLELWKPMFQW